MWIHKEFIEIYTPAEVIWDIYSQVDTWNEWDKDIAWSSLEGQFRANSHGILKPKKGPKVSFLLKTVVRNEGFSTLSKLPFCEIFVDHSIRKIKKGVSVEHSMTISGPTSWIFSRLIGQSFVKSLSGSLKTLKKIAEQRKSN